MIKLAKKKGIQTISVPIQTTKVVSLPVWKVLTDDTQIVRWNDDLGVFEFSYGVGDDEDNLLWEPMEWECFLDANQCDKSGVIESLTNLLALITYKATKRKGK